MNNFGIFTAFRGFKINEKIFEYIGNLIFQDVYQEQHLSHLLEAISIKTDNKMCEFNQYMVFENFMKILNFFQNPERYSLKKNINNFIHKFFRKFNEHKIFIKNIYLYIKYKNKCKKI